MPPPTPLAIATSSLLRLLKEESTYHAELASQEAAVRKLEAAIQHGNGGAGGEADGNAEWRLRQERQAIEETKAVFPSLGARIVEAGVRVERELESVKASGKGGSADEVAKAEEAVGRVKGREKEG